MSTKSRAGSICRHCGHSHSVSIYRSINAVSNPELKDKAADGSLFLWTCPDCGTPNLLVYDCLYHDPDGRVMVWLLPGEDSAGKEMEAIMAQTRAIGDYRLRIVDNVGDFMEKVIIFNAGLDDRCIELVKFVATQEMPEVGGLHFFRIQDDTLVFSGMRRSGADKDTAAAGLETFGIGLNVYEDCAGILARNPDMARECGFERIDPSWVSGIVK